jgi:negative regulator of flagellin synthesis FlgM
MEGIVMDIPPKLPPVHQNSAVQAVKSAKKTAAMLPKDAALQNDRVELSAQAQTILAARRKIQQIAQVDEQKVARIKAEIETGTYRVDSQKAAAGMIAESLLNDLD